MPGNCQKVWNELGYLVLAWLSGFPDGYNLRVLVYHTYHRPHSKFVSFARSS